MFVRREISKLKSEIRIIWKRNFDMLGVQNDQSTCDSVSKGSSSAGSVESLSSEVEVTSFLVYRKDGLYCKELPSGMVIPRLTRVVH